MKGLVLILKKQFNMGQGESATTLWQANSLLLKRSIEIVSFPIKKNVDLSSSLCKRLPGRVYPINLPLNQDKIPFKSAIDPMIFHRFP